MRKQNQIVVFTILVFLIVFMLASCSSKKEDAKDTTTAAEKTALQSSSIEGGVQSKSSDSSAGVSNMPAGVIVDVNGKRLTNSEVDAEINKTIKAYKNQVPANDIKNFKKELRKRLIDGFIGRTILADEIKAQKIKASDQEVVNALEELKASLPQGVTVEDFMKRNMVTKEKIAEDIRFDIQVKKLVSSSVKGDLKPTDKEITNFYQKNKEKFKAPESVHARHIFIAKAAEDDAKARSDKRSKAELLRNRLIEGADFADLASKNSDCPSKQSGGDLGEFTRGQMIKPFDNAAFSQKVNEIGPVVETDLGYHIIQVLEHKQPQTIALNNETKKEISAMLVQQKQHRVFAELMQKLRAKASVTVYEK